jgi:hypothetical protein
MTGRTGGILNVLIPWGGRGHDRITTKFASLNPANGEVYSIQHCVIKFVSDLRQVGGFLWVLWIPPPIKLKYC